MADPIRLDPGVVASVLERRNSSSGRIVKIALVVGAFIGAAALTHVALRPGK